jgi:hypothetical protein
MNAGEIPLAPIDPWIAEDALMVRPYLHVLVHRLPPGGATFLRMVSQGKILGAAVETTLAEISSFDLAENLAGALRAGVFIAAEHAPTGG